MPAPPARSASGATQDLAALASNKDDVQLKAIAETLNAFLVDPIVPKKRVGLVIEVRKSISAEAVFSAGPSALSARPVAPDVLTALRTASHDDNPRVGLEALYAFGALAAQPAGSARMALLRDSASDLASFLGSTDPAIRYAALRVIGRVFARRPGDPPLDTTVADATINAINDSDPAVRAVAMAAVGQMRDVRALQGLQQLYEYYGRGDLGAGALDAIAHIADRSSAALLTTALASKSTTERIIGIEGLARIGDPAALPAIRAAAERDRSDAVQLALAFANARLASAPTTAIVDASSRPKLRDQANGYLAELAAPQR